MFLKPIFSKKSLLILFSVVMFFMGGSKAEACNTYQWSYNASTIYGICSTINYVPQPDDCSQSMKNQVAAWQAVYPYMTAPNYYTYQAYGGCTVPVPPAYPTGVVDSASSGVAGVSCGLVSGWTYDADASYRSINVHMYVDGPAGSGTGYNTGATAVSRPDVNTAYGISGTHGYSYQIPGLSVGTHTVYVYGIGVNGGSNPDGLNSLLSPAPTTFTCSAVNNASCTGLTAPASVTAGSVFSASVTMLNNGTKTWSPGANYNLGSAQPLDNVTWGTNRVSSPATVAPNNSTTINFTRTAPATPGTYPFSWRMVQDGVEWFGTSCSQNITVTVAPPATPTGLTATPQACGTGQINLTWNAVSGATSYTLLDGATTIYTGAAASYAHTGLVAGSAHSYTVRANNAGGSSAYSGAVAGNAPVVCANVIPTANITVPASNQTILLGSSITFTGNGTDTDGSIVGYNWRTGNCTTGTTLSSLASFGTSALTLGTHTVYFSVQDNVSAWSTNCPSRIITVIAPDLSAANTGPAAGTTFTLPANVTFTGTVSNSAAASVTQGGWAGVEIDWSSDGSFEYIAIPDATTQLGAFTPSQSKALSYTYSNPIGGTHRYRFNVDSTNLLSESDEANNRSPVWTSFTVEPAPTADITASPTTIVSGQPSALSWTSTGYTSCSVLGQTFTAGQIGNGSVSPLLTTPYVLQCDGANRDSVIVNVNPPATLTVSERLVTSGDTVTLSWDLNGQLNCTLTGGELGSTYSPLGADIGVTVAQTITARTTYTLKCPVGEVTATVEIIPTGFES